MNQEALLKKEGAFEQKSRELEMLQDKIKKMEEK